MVDTTFFLEGSVQDLSLAEFCYCLFYFILPFINILLILYKFTLLNCNLIAAGAISVNNTENHFWKFENQQRQQNN